MLNVLVVYPPIQRTGMQAETLRKSGTVEQWDSGTVGQWNSGTVEQWECGQCQDTSSNHCFSLHSE